MPQPTKKQKIILIVFAVLIFSIVFTDLLLFYTSLKKGGIARGFSRYWREEQVTSLEEESEMSSLSELPSRTLELVDFEVEFLDTPVLADTEFELLDLSDDYVEKINYNFKTGLVTSGRYINDEGAGYDLVGYESYFLFLNNGCNRLRLLYSDEKEVQFVVGYDFRHPSCPNPTYSLMADIVPHEGESGTVYLGELVSDFNYVFDGIHSFLADNVSDLGYRYKTLSLLYYYSEYALDYLDNLEGLIPIDSYGDRVVYLKESDESFRFVFFNVEGFPVELEMTYEESLYPDFLNHSVSIVLENGEKVDYKYSRWDPDSCVRNPVYGSTVEGLQVVGEAMDGSSVFVKEGRDDSYLKNIYRNRYLNEERHLFNEIEEDSEVPYTYEEFIKVLPVIYWQSPFGKVLRFVRYDFLIPPNQLGHCGFVS